MTRPRMSVADPSTPRRRRPSPGRRHGATRAAGTTALTYALLGLGRARRARSCSSSTRRIPTTTPTTRSCGARSSATGSCRTTTCSARRRRTRSPRWSAWALAPFGTASDRILVLASLFGLLGFYVVTFVFTERLLGRADRAASRSRVMLTRTDMQLLALRAMFDLPFYLMVFGAALLELRRPRCGWPVLAGARARRAAAAGGVAARPASTGSTSRRSRRGRC